MNLKNTSKIAIRSLKRRKLRTLLTVFAVFIGVFLIVLFVSAAIGGKDVILGQITEQLDLRQIMVSKKGSMFAFARPMDVKVSDKEEEIKKITDESIKEISSINHVEGVYPAIIIGQSDVRIDEVDKKFVAIIGSGFEPEKLEGYVKEVLAGSINDLKDGEVILGEKVAEATEMDYGSLIGKKVVVTPNTSSFLSSKRKDTGYELELRIRAVVDIGSDNASFIISPTQAASYNAKVGGFDNAKQYLKEVGYDSLFVMVDDVENAEDVAKQINDLGYEAMTVDNLMKLFDNVFLIIQVIFSMFGVIALFVAAVGIANTMVMSVYERTKEIGMLKALGATKQEIRRMFIIEASIIGLIGGITGVVISLLLELVINYLVVRYFFEPKDLNIDSVFVTPWYLVIGVILLSVIIGILSGLYPSNKAANLDPIKALSSE